MSDMEAVERAARALWSLNGRPLKPVNAAPAMAVPEDEPDWKRFVPQVCAVMAAIRVPDRRMILEGESAASQGIGKPVDDEALPKVWQAMVDAALIGAISDNELVAAYQRTDGEPGNPEADALAAEIKRRNLDV